MTAAFLLNSEQRWPTPLLEPSTDDREYLDATTICSDIKESDFPDWEERLRDPAASPLPHMRKQRQRRNDCQGQALAGGTEARRHYTTGQMEQLSDIYAYNATEYLTGPTNVGRDRGSNILIGVRVIAEGIPTQNIKPGLPTEEAWPYDTYERDADSFIERARSAAITDGCLAEQLPMPPWREMLVAMAARATAHIGTYWPPRWSQLNGCRLMDRTPRGGGGHATEIIWAAEIEGEWYLVVWNSHGDGFYYMSRRCYEDLQQQQFRPYGARLLMPIEAKQRYVNWASESPYFD